MDKDALEDLVISQDRFLPRRRKVFSIWKSERNRGSVGEKERRRQGWSNEVTRRDCYSLLLLEISPVRETILSVWSVPTQRATNLRCNDGKFLISWREARSLKIKGRRRQSVRRARIVERQTSSADFTVRKLNNGGNVLENFSFHWSNSTDWFRFLLADNRQPVRSSFFNLSKGIIIDSIKRMFVEM